MVDFNRKKLSNGLTILHEKRDVPVTTVMMSVPFGAMYEDSSEKGIAHFIEHLCFKGTDKRTTYEISSALEKVGGDLNAFTHEEMTAYHVRLPSNHLELGIDVISDIFFNPNFPEDEVEKEAKVICEEIKMYHDNPRSHSIEMIKRNLYEDPFGMFTAGTEEIIKSMTRDQLLKKHREIYIPKNAVLCVVGNNSFEDVVSFAENYIAPIEREGIVLKDNLSVSECLEDSSEKRSDVMQTNMALGFHFPVDDESKYAALLFNAILGDGMSSRLFTEVREKRGLVYTIKSDLDLGRNYGYMIIFAGTDASHVDDVTKLSLEEFSKLQDITEEELEEIKTQVIGNMVLEREASNITAIHLIMEEFSSKAEDFYEFDERIRAVSVSDIKRLASISSHARFYVGP